MFILLLLDVAIREQFVDTKPLKVTQYYDNWNDGYQNIVAYGFNSEQYNNDISKIV